MADTPTLEALRQYTDEQVKAAIDAWFTEDGSQADSVNWEKRMRAALAAADAALSVQAEPFAYWAQSDLGRVFSDGPGGMGLQWHPLYATPQPPAPVPAAPLTEAQIAKIEERIWKTEFFDDIERQANREFASAIERAHNITGGSNG